MDKIERIKELVTELNRYSYEYYTLSNSSISDKEYDKKYTELQLLEKETGFILPYSPSMRIGDIVLDKFEKHEHKFKCYSMDKAQTFDELIEWDKRNRTFVRENNLPKIQYVVAKKFDGLTINNTYDEEGILISSATRGTGEIGELVTSQIKTIKSIPLSINYSHLVEMHGEALMTKKAFEKYNETAEVPLKNLRNGAAGAVKNLNVKETAKRNLSAFFYDVGYNEGQPFKTYIDMMQFIEKKGLPVDKEYYLCDTIEEVKEKIDLIEELRPNLDYEIDGAIVSINDIRTRELMGYTIKFPRWAIAYKYEATETTTTLLNVEWNTGRSGKVTPRAELEPVDLLGTTVGYATLNNMDDIKRKNVKIGGTVFLRRSNDVIPEILGNADDEGIEILPPTHCKACGTELILDGAHYFCPNTLGCRPQLTKSITHFCEREAMNLDGLSIKTVEQFMDNGVIDSIVDLYRLESKKSQIVKLDKFGLKKYNNLIEGVNNARKCKLHQLIYGLGIENVGIKTAKDLAKEFKSIENLTKASISDLLKVEDIGDVVAESISSWFNTERNINLLSELLKEITIIEEEKKVSSVKENPLQGKSVYPTGKFSLKKDELKVKLEELGAIVEGGYKKSLDYLICGGDTSKSGKVDKALKDNVKLMTEEELMNIING